MALSEVKTGERQTKNAYNASSYPKKKSRKVTLHSSSFHFVGRSVHSFQGLNEIPTALHLPSLLCGPISRSTSVWELTQKPDTERQTRTRTADNRWASTWRSGIWDCPLRKTSALVFDFGNSAPKFSASVCGRNRKKARTRRRHLAQIVYECGVCTAMYFS